MSEPFEYYPPLDEMIEIECPDCGQVFMVLHREFVFPDDQPFAHVAICPARQKV